MQPSFSGWLVTCAYLPVCPPKKTPGMPASEPPRETPTPGLPSASAAPRTPHDFAALRDQAELADVDLGIRRMRGKG